MNIKAIKKKVTLMLDSDIYDSLKSKAGERGIGAYMSNLVRPLIVVADIDSGYKALSQDASARKESREWLENMNEPLSADDEKEVWQF